MEIALGGVYNLLFPSSLPRLGRGRGSSSDPPRENLVGFLEGKLWEASPLQTAISRNFSASHQKCVKMTKCSYQFKAHAAPAPGKQILAVVSPGLCLSLKYREMACLAAAVL